MLAIGNVIAGENMKSQWVKTHRKKLTITACVLVGLMVVAVGFNVYIMPQLRPPAKPLHHTGNEFFDAIMNLPTIPDKKGRGIYGVTEEFRKEFPGPVDMKMVEKEFMQYGFREFREFLPNPNVDYSPTTYLYLLRDVYTPVEVQNIKPHKYVTTTREDYFMLRTSSLIVVTFGLDEKSDVIFVIAETSIFGG